MKRLIESIKYVFQDKGARVWSNQELKKFAHFFSGDVVNVSGWDDRDKEGEKYTNYFKRKKSYTITNYKGERGISNLPNEIYLDLEQPLPKELERKFDVVFNHTTLEHVFDIFTAFKNICLLSRDIVVVVFPFIEEVHEAPNSFGDYWRPTHLAIERLFQKNGFTVLYGSSRKIPPVYYFFIASRKAEKWKNVFGEYKKDNIVSGNQLDIFRLHLIKYFTLPFRKPMFFLKYIFRRKK
ncbi:MAG: hypothetical protein ACE5J0_01100 [Candidatus Paceibacterales bacterium]